MESVTSKPLPPTLFDDSTQSESPLSDTTFTVVDLETTGMRADTDHIIEIGAVKVRGGQQLGTFSTFVDAGVEVPPFISQLTGISNKDLDGAPLISTALQEFLKFAQGSVWVAHNAKFDIGFLRESCRQLNIVWPAPTVVDTLQLARQLLDRNVTKSFKLGDLARFVGATTSPTHRALDDALATADVLHYLFEVLAGHHVESLDALESFTPKVPAAIREKRSLIDGVSHAPGVYVFRATNGDPLYIGTAVDLRRRLLQYFNGTDSRRKISEMVQLAHSVDTIECAHGMAAEVREARLLAARRPPYNRQRTEPGRGWYLVPNKKLDSARISRLPDGTNCLGPFRTRNSAAEIRDALCIGESGFTETITEILQSGDSYIEGMLKDIESKALEHRFKRAALLRDLTAEFIFVLDKQQRLSMLANVPQLQAAFPDGHGGWHLIVVRYGRLAASGTAPRGSNAAHISALLAQNAETVIPNDNLYRGASIDELTIVWKWLSRPEVRIGPTEGIIASPLHGAGKFRQWAIAAQDAKRS